ncbi:MAG: hypothetical protein ACTS4T_01595 [Candidatus Hodgkinia cicadicola]
MSQRSASTAKPRPLRLSRGRRRLFSIPQVNLRSSSCGIVNQTKIFKLIKSAGIAKDANNSPRPITLLK